ncbi:hypothetical protein AALP_AA5G093300 [Arabis alpina]|uniref:Uncharacterized protein n=1 Tax=Arabis alpina TaxID=50452 RepID=A0A087GVY1_ARAAL|nr:hypothetical protein AALP_AA5G093300 [Arabis alpina]
MERPRSFRSLVPRTTGSGKPPTPTTASTSAAPTTVSALAEPTIAPLFVTPTTAPGSARPITAPASTKPTTVLASGPRDTSSARKTTSTAKGSRLPSVTRTEVVAALLVLPAPLPSDYEAKKAAKGKGHEGDDRKRSSDRDDLLGTFGAGPREQCSAAIVTKRDGKFATVVEKLRKADKHIQSLERKFTRAKDKFNELQGDPRSNMVYQVQRVANLDFVRLLLGLLDGQEPPKLEDELTFLTADVAEHAGDEERFEQLMKSLHGLLHVLDPKVKAPAVVTHDRTYEASIGVADPSGFRSLEAPALARPQ